MSPIEHAPTETNGAIAAPDTNGRYVVYTSTQALFFSVDTCAKISTSPPTPSTSSAAPSAAVWRQGGYADRALAFSAPC
jgi:CO/xanthine dehydrogenase Mo-binding subunit